jgi:predicted  nucleic acid-binding Zn-ribbon protein
MKSKCTYPYCACLLWERCETRPTEDPPDLIDRSIRDAINDILSDVHIQDLDYQPEMEPIYEDGVCIGIERTGRYFIKLTVLDKKAA